MRAFDSVVKDKRNELSAKAKQKINEQKDEILSQLLKDRNVKSAYDLNESNRASLKATLLNMWSPETGLNKKGYSYLFESEIPELTEKSTPDEIVKWISASIAGKDNLDFMFTACTDLIINNDPKRYSYMIETTSKAISKMTKNNIDPSKVAAVILNTLFKFIQEKAKQVQFDTVKAETNNDQPQNQEQQEKPEEEKGNQGLNFKGNQNN